MPTTTVARSALPDHRAWEDLKEHIVHLYLGEQRTLREVKAKMESQYGFKATVRMYKHRFRMWDVAKYKPRRPQGGDKNLAAVVPRVAVPGQPADVPKYHQALVVFLGIQDWVAGTAPISLTSPEPRLLQWDSDLTGVCEAFAFSSALFHRGCGYLAGKAFRKAFITLEKALAANDILLLWVLVDILFDMLKQGQSEMMTIFLNHVAQLGAASLPRCHPVTQVFRHLALLPADDLQGGIRQAWRCNYDLVLPYLRPSVSVESREEPLLSPVALDYNPELPKTGLIVLRGFKDFRPAPASRERPFAVSWDKAHRGPCSSQSRPVNNPKIGVPRGFVYPPHVYLPEQDANSMGSMSGPYGNRLTDLSLTTFDANNSKWAEAAEAMKTRRAMVKDEEEKATLGYMTELWWCEEVTARSGNLAEAREIEQEIISRAKQHLADIPDHAV